jgi:PspA-Associated protein
MIIRIFGEGQYELPEPALARLHELDADTENAVITGDNKRFHDAYSQLLAHIRTQGTPVTPDDLRPSDLLLPPADSSVTEVARELEALELIPG